MKLVGIVGSNSDHSYNRLLLKEIQRRFTHLFNLELLEIIEVPLFNPGLEYQHFPVIRQLNDKILAADGVIIATPEHNHTITPALKSVLEWLSYKVHPFEDKPVMVVGASYDVLGTSRSQLHLRQILEAPGIRAHVFPGKEFLLGRAKEAFDAEGNLVEPRTIQYLGECIEKFVRFVNVLKQVEAPRHRSDGIIHHSYQLGDFSKGMDDSEVATIIQRLKKGETTVAHYYVPTGNDKQFIVHTFQTVKDEDGSIVSIEEFIMDYAQMIAQYLEQTGQKLVKDERVNEMADSRNEDLSTQKVDEVSGASQQLKSSTPVKDHATGTIQTVDTTTSPTQLSAQDQETLKESKKFIYTTPASQQEQTTLKDTAATKPHILKVVDVTSGASKKQQTNNLDSTSGATVKHLLNDSKSKVQESITTQNSEENKEETVSETSQISNHPQHQPKIIDVTSGASDKF